MQMIRSIFISALMMVPFLKGYADELKESASIGVDTYSDNGDVQIYSPTLSFMKKLSKHWLIGFKMRIDAIAAASIRFGGPPSNVDAVATASHRSGFEDVRYAPTFLAAYDDGDNSMGAGLYYSTEKDYIGRSFFFNYTRQFNKGNTAVGLSYSRSADKLDPVFKRNIVKNKDEEKVDISLNQLIDPTLSVQLIYSYIDASGFLASPYYYNSGGFERYPGKRTGHAFSLKGLKYLDESNSFNFSYRYYTDDWEIDSHTVSAEWLHDLNEKVIVGARLRYYTQTSAFFEKEEGSYSSKDRYNVVDYRMSAFNAYDIGIPIRYKPSKESPYTFSFTADYYRTGANDYIKQWYGVDALKALYTTLRIDYEF